jgi:hypothetical protein
MEKQKYEKSLERAKKKRRLSEGGNKKQQETNKDHKKKKVKQELTEVYFKSKPSY